MLILVSGEGPSDMGRCVASDQCDGAAFVPGPMAWIVDQLAELKCGYPFLSVNLFSLISKKKLAERSKGLSPPTLPGRKRRQETAYYFRNARALSQFAVELAGQSDDEVIAVLFRDADGTQTAGRGHWQDKWDSMLNGFGYENFDMGVPMIPKPKSEAWLLCALKQNQPYQHCDSIENESGNDKAPNSLKSQLAAELGQLPNATLLSNLVRNGSVDSAQIDMPSFVRFRERLESVI